MKTDYDPEAVIREIKNVLKKSGADPLECVTILVETSIITTIALLTFSQDDDIRKNPQKHVRDVLSMVMDKLLGLRAESDRHATH